MTLSAPTPKPQRPQAFSPPPHLFRSPLLSEPASSFDGIFRLSSTGPPVRRAVTIFEQAVIQARYQDPTSGATKETKVTFAISLGPRSHKTGNSHNHRQQSHRNANRLAFRLGHPVAVISLGQIVAGRGGWPGQPNTRQTSPRGKCHDGIHQIGPDASSVPAASTPGRSMPGTRSDYESADAASLWVSSISGLPGRGCVTAERRRGSGAKRSRSGKERVCA